MDNDQDSPNAPHARIVQALGDPAAWSVCHLRDLSWCNPMDWLRWLFLKSSGALVLKHPAGHIVCANLVHNSEKSLAVARLSVLDWKILSFSPHGQDTLARFPSHHDAASIETFRSDLDRAYGPLPRARIEGFLHLAKTACLHMGLRGHVEIGCPDRAGHVAFVSQDHHPRGALPNACQDALAGLHPIVWPNPTGTLLRCTKRLNLDLPTSMHGVLQALGDQDKVS